MTADILQIAREAGATAGTRGGLSPANLVTVTFTDAQLTAFAARIRAEAMEEAAKVCESLRDKWVDGSDQWGRPCPARVRVTPSDCAAAIRAQEGKSNGNPD